MVVDFTPTENLMLVSEHHLSESTKFSMLRQVDKSAERIKYGQILRGKQIEA